jgi:GT2 family glycosyltransferase
MGLPKVSVIWLNYNSMRIIDIVLESLESIADLDYPGDRYELIAVDNGSSDGSFEKIRSFLERKSSLRKKIIRSEKNLGFTGGNNLGFGARDPESRYVLLLNNDAVIRRDGLARLIEFAESNPSVGSVQGVVLRYRSNVIDTAGDFVSELLHVYLAGSGETYPWILKRPIYVSYADGSCVLYRVDAVKRCCGDKLFIDEFFGYGDDNVLGLMLWSHGFSSVSLNKVVAEHLRGASFGRRSLLSQYLYLRNHTALLEISNSRYRSISKLIMARAGLSCIRDDTCKYSFKAIFGSGLRLSKFLKKKLYIDLYKAPLIRIDPLHIPLLLASKKYVENYFKKWFIQNISNLEIKN